MLHMCYICLSKCELLAFSEYIIYARMKRTPFDPIGNMRWQNLKSHKESKGLNN